MRKYYCDICESEIQFNNLRVGSLDFNRGNLELCLSCFPKLKSAKESLYDEYSLSYGSLDTAYITDLKDKILTNVDPSPIFEDDDPEQEPTTPNTNPEPVFEEDGE